jgi:hypothetical protein
MQSKMLPKMLHAAYLQQSRCCLTAFLIQRAVREGGSKTTMQQGHKDHVLQPHKDHRDLSISLIMELGRGGPGRGAGVGGAVGGGSHGRGGWVARGLDAGEGARGRAASAEAEGSGSGGGGTRGPGPTILENANKLSFDNNQSYMMITYIEGERAAQGAEPACRRRLQLSIAVKARGLQLSSK